MKNHIEFTFRAVRQVWVRGLDSGHQAWWQRRPAELSLWPSVGCFEVGLLQGLPAFRRVPDMCLLLKAD